MSLIIEDGTGKADSQSYISVEDTNAYHTLMGNTDWTGTEAEKEIYLLKASQYVEQKYDNLFVGQVGSSTQRMLWPRIDAYIRKDTVLIASNAIPEDLQYAIAEFALKVAEGDTLGADVAASQNLKSEESVVGPIEKKVEYIGGKNSAKKYPIAEGLIAIFLDPPGIVNRS